MSEEFKRKLEAYEKGQLTQQEIEEFEKELDRYEQYQESLMEEKQGDTNEGLDERKQKRVLRRGKWKARIQTALTALLMVIVFYIVSSVLTSIYYAWGTPDRTDVYRNVIDHTLTVTNPYGYMGGTSVDVQPFFRMEATRELNKSVGHDTFQIGEMKVDFLFSMMGVVEEESYGKQSQNIPTFLYPGSNIGVDSQWDRLERLPEGTVVSAYLSFNKLIGTREVFDQFEDNDMDVLWLAVDTGVESPSESDGVISFPLGFPSFPIWHDDDMILHSREEKKGHFGGVVSESYSSPESSTDDVEVYHKQFLKTLSFLEDHEKIVSKLLFGELDLSDRIAYLEENEVKHYGVVITGPTKEVLKLQEEPWIGNIEVDEVGFWNWIS
ncbi:anti-sigma factor [Radiobacillus kanasensis]|uniref:anti-sigma factor n=1 Tax=Radiobacillus kanasensis TaxID=2844358 RepID=UPI001E31CDBF|nr:anti-sigma factor [Radiobacillus kanasensis]UFT99575.1 anti-sigma factor [Radiobacillus kanasensis]